MHQLLADLHHLWPAGALSGRHQLRGLSAGSRASRRQTDLPALPTARLSADRHRLVRPLLTRPPAQAAAACVRQVRPGAPPCRAGTVLGLLAKAPRPALQHRRQPARTPHRPTDVAGRLRRPPRRPALRQPSLHHDQRSRSAPGGRTPQSSAGSPGACSSPRPLDGLPRPRTGGLLHPARPGLPTNHADQLAAGRRRRRIEAAPLPLRPQIQAFSDALLRARERALRAGTLPRADITIEATLAIVRDLARFLADQRGKSDWALADVHDIEAFLATQPKARQRRLTVLRQYFRFARSGKVVLVDPTRGLKAKGPSGFSGTTVAVDQQRQFFRRWTTTTDAHPHEALLGMLALLHAASSSEVRYLRVDDIEPNNRTVQLGKRPHPVPIDPASWSVLQRCLAHRESQRTDNPHVIVTKITKSGRSAASTAYVSHIMDPCGVPPRTLRCTRLADLVNTLDPKLVAAVLGMDPEGVMIYLADHVEAGRLLEQRERRH